MGAVVLTGRRGRRTLRRPATVAVLGTLGVLLVATIVGGVVAGLVGDGGDDDRRPGSGAPGLTADALRTYEAALVPVLQEGGTLVELGLKVGIGDLGGEHRTAPSVVAGQARGWQADLDRLAARLAAMAPPPQLADAHRHMAAAIEGYARSAGLIEQAALADPQSRDRLLDEAARLGRLADERFDAGARAFQSARRGLGLEPHPDVADPSG